MPRFTDEWVIDRTLFEYASGGSCACCGFNHALFMPNGVEGLIQSISDMDTDAAQLEISALDKSPWPLELRQQVWADRVRLRMKLKQNINQYTEFWSQHGDEFTEWMTSTLTPKQIKKLLQLPKREVTSALAETYNIHTAFASVLCAVTEQVANYSHTKYATDGIGQEEVDFEQALIFDRRGGFTLSNILSDDKQSVHPETLQILLNRIQSLGSGKLLNRKVSSSKQLQQQDEEDDDEEEGNADDAREQDGDSIAAKPGFSSDRRIVRLLIARQWADTLQTKYLKYKQQQECLVDAKDDKSQQEE